MGLKNSRPLPLAATELEMAPFFKRRFRTWHLDHISLVVERYRALTSRHCIDSIQLSAILGIKDQALIQELMRLFMPKAPTRVHHMIDAMEVVISLILVCQAPSMLHRYEAIFDVIDLDVDGVITPADLVMLFGAVGRSIMKIFRYAVEPQNQAAMAYINSVLASGVAGAGTIEKAVLCTLMLSDQYAVHYVKQCTGEDKPKLYVMLEKDTELLGALEFHTLEQMKSATLKTIRELAETQLYKIPSDFAFLCNGHEVKRVWEADRKAWSIVPFAMRGSPGLRTNTVAHNRNLDRPRRANVFEFRYMGNTIPRYKRKVSEINPVYKHRSFKISGQKDVKPLASVVKWRVAENWSGEWLYDQRKIAAATKTKIQKHLRTAPTPKSERVAIKNHKGELISPLGVEDSEADTECRPTTSVDQVKPKLYENSPAAVIKKKEDRKAREKNIKWKARVIAMNAIQQLDGAPEEEDPAFDKENEPRRANRTASLDVAHGKKPELCTTTVLIHVQDPVQTQTSRLFVETYLNRKHSKHMKSTKAHHKLQIEVIPEKMELRTPSKLSDGQINLGPFQAASNVELEEDEVEVFPVIVIRPCGEVVEIQAEADEPHNEVRSTFTANVAYLTEYEFDISATESNFEHIYHHVHGTCQDLITLNRCDVFGRTMLHDAAEYGHTKLIELLLNVRVLRDVGDFHGDTPLHHAARRGHLKEVSALLRAGIAAWQLNCEGKSALYCALEAAGKQMKQSAVSHKRPPPRINDKASTTHSSKEVELTKILAAKDAPVYTKMRQAIDLLWDQYPVSVLIQPDHCDRTNCLDLERQIFGDLFQACRDGNLIRVQRLIDLDKRPTAQYINERLENLGRTGLHEAAEQGHTAIVDLLLKFGADGYVADQREQLPLHVAAERGYDRIVKCLVAKFPGSLHLKDCCGRTALHLAAERNHTDVCLHLVAAISGRSNPREILDAQDMHGFTALHYSCVHGNLVVCQAIVNAGASTDISHFETSVRPGQAGLLGMYWKRLGQSTTGRGRRTLSSEYSIEFDLESPAELLLRGCKQRQQGYQDRLRILRLLLPGDRVRKCQPSLKTSKVTPSPLVHLAVEVADVNPSIAVDVCKTLHELHYEVNLVHHETAESAILQECQRVCRLKHQPGHAESPGDLAVVRTLVQIGASVNLPNERTGETPLACAAWYGHVLLLDFLLEAGAQCNFVPKGSFAPLHFAALGDRIACAKLLLGNNADVNVHTQSPKQEEAPLFFAIRSKSVSMVEHLLERGADPCAVCTLKRGVTTSFGIRLAVDPRKKLTKAAVARMPSFGPGREHMDDGEVTIASPVTFALLIARPLFAYNSQSESTGIARAQRRHEWEALNRIALLVAKRAIASMTPSGSAGSSLVTRNDVYLACYLGYWDLAKLFLTQQVMMPNSSTSSKPNSLHLAAASGRTDVVSALVAAGMHVNCRVAGAKSMDLESRVPKSLVMDRTMTVVKHYGPLYFALVHGHVETAAKLLVLGAQPLDSVPHHLTTIKSKNPEMEAMKPTRIHVTLDIHESTTKDAKDLFFAAGDRRDTREIDAPAKHGYHHTRVLANFVTHLEGSLNFKVPLLHYAAGMGYTSAAELLIDAGMSFVAPEPIETTGLTLSACRREWRAETAIHVAILCGHLDVVRLFAGRAQYNFPRFFLREGKKPKSLLDAACRAKRLDILRFLISSGSARDVGGGYNGDDTPDDIHEALTQCVLDFFIEGVMLLLQERARPDLESLSFAMENLKPKTLAAATQVIQAINPFAKHFDKFFNVLSFDNLLKVFIVCSRYDLWFVLEDVFIANAKQFMELLSPWKPLLVRAASCCMVLHRAAAANQVRTLSFFLQLGVPADLTLIEFPQARCPMWYAATRGALQAMVLLALHSKNGLSEAVDTRRRAPPRPHYRSIESSTSWFSTTSTCRWQNLNAMSCYDTPTPKSNVVLVAKLINLWIHESRNPKGNSLLHLACSTGDPVVVQVLVDAGADVFTENHVRETPLIHASTRKDAFGATIVRSLLAATRPRQERSKDDDDLVRLHLSRALVACFAQPPPCNLKTAKLLLAAGADVNFEHETLGSAMKHAFQSVQFFAVKVLMDSGAKLSLPLVEVFLSQFQVNADGLKTHWRTYSSYMKARGQRLLEVESVLQLLLEKKHSGASLNENLVLQMLNATAAIAATTAKSAGHDKRFWDICSQLVEQFASTISSRKTVWGHKSALHYAVQSLEFAVVRQLVQRCGFEADGEDENKATPLHIVASNGDAGVCKILLDSMYRDPSRIDCPNAMGRTPLHVAAIHGFDEVVAQLVRAGASLQKRCPLGLNAHLYAASLNHVSTLMVLYDQDSSRELLYTSRGEFAAFCAAKNASFRVVRWLESVFEASEPSGASISSYWTLKCLDFQRTLLHYAARFGDVDLVKHALDSTTGDHLIRIVDAKDAAGYTPLMYAFAFGKLGVVELLLRAGADASVSVDHTSEANTHPYASHFSIATIGEYVALPGWFTYVSTQFPPQEKRCLTSELLSNEHYLLSMGYHRRRMAKEPVVVLGRGPKPSADHKTIERSSVRSWKFPRASLLELACETGDANLVTLLARLPLPGLIRHSSSYAVLRRAFLEAVKWNRLDIVKQLLDTRDAGIVLTKSCTTKTSDVQFSEFIEVAIDTAMSRGLEDMAMLLLSHWKGLKENSGEDKTSFAFQFSHVFQVACIRNMVKLAAYMLTRGGEPLVTFHWQDGPPLLYAFAFGHTKLASMLLKYGAHVSSMDTYVAPSFQKWIEYGCPHDVQVQWYELSAGKASAQAKSIELPEFQGPLEAYEPEGERLDSAMMAAIFVPPDSADNKTDTPSSGQEKNELAVDGIELTIE